MYIYIYIIDIEIPSVIRRRPRAGRAPGGADRRRRSAAAGSAAERSQSARRSWLRPANV